MTGEEDTTVSHLYESQFKPGNYKSQYYSAVDEEERFFLSQLHHFFLGLKDEKECRPRVVLEVGSGPLITGLVSASARADLLIYSDLLEVNMAEISSSLRGQRAPDSEQSSLELIASLEKCSVERLWERLVSSPSLVSKSNILSPGLISSHLHLPAPPTIIISKLCLEFALSHPSQLHSAIQRICWVLGRQTRNGVLLLMGALGESHYYIGGTRFPAISLSREILEEAIRSQPDLDLVYWREMARVSDKLTKPTGHSAVYFLCARKR